MAEDTEDQSADAAAEAGDHGHDEEIHMPPNSWWPMVVSIGVAMTLVGIIFLDLPFVIIIGAIIMVGGILMWVVDARKEYQELH